MAKRDLVLDDEAIREYVNQGMSARQVGRMLGVSEPTALKNIRRLGLQIMSRPHYKESMLTKEDYEQALEFCFTTRDVAEHFNLSVSHVREKLEQFGLQPKNFRKRNEFIQSEEELHIDLSKCVYAKPDRSIKKVTINGKRYLDITNSLCD